MAVGISGVEKPSSGGGGMELEEEPTLVSLVLFSGFCWVVPVFPDGVVLQCIILLTLRLSFSLCFFARHSRTRHQFYLQLRKDVLEERLYCNDETLLQLGVLALQAEFGSYPKEVGVISGVTGKRTVGGGGC